MIYRIRHLRLMCRLIQKIINDKLPPARYFRSFLISVPRSPLHVHFQDCLAPSATGFLSHALGLNWRPAARWMNRAFSPTAPAQPSSPTVVLQPGWKNRAIWAWSKTSEKSRQRYIKASAKTGLTNHSTRSGSITRAHSPRARRSN